MNSLTGIYRHSSWRDQLSQSADCVRDHPILPYPGRRLEPEFYGWRQAALNALIRERRPKPKSRPTRKPRQQRAFLIRFREYLKQRTGRWRPQSSANLSHIDIGQIQGKFALIVQIAIAPDETAVFIGFLGKYRYKLARVIFRNNRGRNVNNRGPLRRNIRE